MSKYLTGSLHFDTLDERWVIRSPEGEHEWLTSGACCDLEVGGHWIPTRVEHCGRYYAVTPGLRLEIGLRARIRR